jgi:O-antigen ligase
MTAKTSTRQILRKPDLARLGPLLILSILSGLYAVLIWAVDNNRLSVLLFALPVGLGLLVLPNRSRVLMALLVFSLSFSARFRLAPGAEFQAGAEASIAPTDIPLFALAMLAFAEGCLRPRRIRFYVGRFGLAFVALLLVYLVSLGYAHDRGLVLLQIIRLLRMGLLVVVVRHYVRDRQDVVLVTFLLLLSVILQGALALVQAFFHTSLGLGFLGERDTIWVVSYGGVNISRSGGTMGHANALANYLEALFPMALALLLGRTPLDRGQSRLRTLAWLALPLGLIGLFLTFSRAGWGSSLVGIAVVLLVSAAIGAARRTKVILTALLVSACLGIVVALLWEPISQRVSVFGSNSWLVRTGTVQVATEIIKQNPWLGVGTNNYMSVAHEYVPYDMHAMFGELIAHNLFYLVTAETGLSGLLVFVFLLWSVISVGYKAAKAKVQPLSYIALGILGGIAALITHGLFDWLFFYDPIHTLFWFLTGFLVAILDIASREKGTVVNSSLPTTQTTGPAV